MELTIAFAFGSVYVPGVTNDVSTSGLAARFARIVHGLCDVLGDYEARERTAGPFVFLIRQLLRRRLASFIALVSRFYAGTMRAARPSATSHSRSERAVSERYWDPMPRDRAWLRELLPRISTYVGLFEELLADPEMAGLLAAAPQAGRLLRPLWWIVSRDPFPHVLRAPPRRRCPPDAAPHSSSSEGGPARGRPGSSDPERPRVRHSRPRVVRCSFGPILA